MVLPSALSRLRPVAQIGLAFAVGSLLVQAPGPVWRELQFVLEILLVTIVTRTVAAQAAVSALALGIGVAVPASVLVGHAFTALGADMTDAPANWAIVPAAEEIAKLVPVAILLAVRQRRTRLAFNPSDYLLLGCAAGAGFGMVENAMLVEKSGRVFRDMLDFYGPHVGGFYLVSGAWGEAGYVGHAAATGLVTGALGLSLALRARTRRGEERPPFPWFVPAAAGAAWIVGEHLLANLHVDTGSKATFILGNGRLTPWIFVGLAAYVVWSDWRAARATLRQSPSLRKRLGLLWTALTKTGGRPPKSRVALTALFAAQVRLLNATAWFVQTTRSSTPTGAGKERTRVEAA